MYRILWLNFKISFFLFTRIRNQPKNSKRSLERDFHFASRNLRNYCNVRVIWKEHANGSYCISLCIFGEKESIWIFSAKIKWVILFLLLLWMFQSTSVQQKLCNAVKVYVTFYLIHCKSDLIEVLFIMFLLTAILCSVCFLLYFYNFSKSNYTWSVINHLVCQITVFVMIENC